MAAHVAHPAAAGATRAAAGDGGRTRACCLPLTRVAAVTTRCGLRNKEAPLLPPRCCRCLSSVLRLGSGCELVAHARLKLCALLKLKHAKECGGMHAQALLQLLLLPC